MININVRTNSKQLIAELRADQKAIKVATVQALNRTAEQYRTQAGRYIREVYNIKLAAVRKASKLLRASRSSRYPQAEITFAGRPIPLIEFEARERRVMTNRGPRRAVTVKVLVKGQRKVVSGGFVGSKGGKRMIFKRAGAARYPIKNLRSVSIPRALEQKALTQALIRFADDRFTTNYEAALRNQARG
jgi:hypothetical protein